MKKIFTLACCVAAAFSCMADGFTPESGAWYRLLNRETGSGREGSYLGYYPSTPWYVFSKENGSRADLTTNPFICAGNLAEGEDVTEAQIDGQLWQFIAGTGENEGKYCLVNKAYPDGAISNLIYNNNEEQITELNGNNATNASRWKYVEDRVADAANVCWFDWSSTPTDVNDITYYQPTFTNPVNSSGIYMSIAVAPQKFQVIRVDTSGEASTWWAPIAESAGEPDVPVIPDDPVVEPVKPVAALWYRIKSGETDDRANTYMGYYPQTAWYVFPNIVADVNKVLTTNPFVCGCNYADPNAETDPATEAQLDGQLWQLIEGTGENEGKYCFVNKSNPNGAISNIPLNNNGEVLTSGATNASRWGYVTDRAADAAEVCWFSLNDGADVEGNSAFILEFVNTVTPANKYLALAKGGQNFQLMRWNTVDDAGSRASYRWTFIPYTLVEDATCEVQGVPEIVDNTISFTSSHVSYEVTLTAPDGCELYYKNNATAEAEMMLLADGEDDTNDGFVHAENGTVTLTADKEGEIQWYVVANGIKSPVSTLSFIDPEGVTSSISEISLATEKSIFDLQGRRVSRATNGLYIINGKKILVK